MRKYLFEMLILAAAVAALSAWDGATKSPEADFAIAFLPVWVAITLFRRRTTRGRSETGF